MKDNARQIQIELDRLEKEERITLLYACESGSRAWGFESADSDYDVRFIYAHPTQWYLSIQNRRDVIERMIGTKLDMSGWDLPKALSLFSRSNPPLFEWLQSSCVYMESGSLATRLRQLMPAYYSPRACMFHYLHMARGNYREYLRGDHVWLKKYFYVLRPVLACLWIERQMGIMPMAFSKLVDGIVDDPALRKDIERLLAEKMRGSELDYGPRIGSISDFIDTHIERLSAEHQQASPGKELATLDRLFRETLIEVNGPIL